MDRKNLTDEQLKELQAISHEYVTSEEELNCLMYFLEFSAGEILESVKRRVLDAKQLIYISHGTTSAEVRTKIKKRVKELHKEISALVEIGRMMHDYDSSDYTAMGCMDGYYELVNNFTE